MSSSFNFLEKYTILKYQNKQKGIYNGKENF